MPPFFNKIFLRKFLFYKSFLVLFFFKIFKTIFLFIGSWSFSKILTMDKIVFIIAHFILEIYNALYIFKIVFNLDGIYFSF